MKLYTKIQVIFASGMGVGLYMMNPYITFGAMIIVFISLFIELYIVWWKNENKIN